MMSGNDGIGLLETPRLLRAFLWEGMVMPNPLYRQHIISISDFDDGAARIAASDGLEVEKAASRRFA